MTCEGCGSCPARHSAMNLRPHNRVTFRTTACCDDWLCVQGANRLGGKARPAGSSYAPHPAPYTHLGAHWLQRRFPLLLWRRGAGRGGRRFQPARQRYGCGKPLKYRHEPQHQAGVMGLLSPALSSKGGEGEPLPRCLRPPDACKVQPLTREPSRASRRAPGRCCRRG